MQKIPVEKIKDFLFSKREISKGNASITDLKEKLKKLYYYFFFFFLQKEFFIINKLKYIRPPFHVSNENHSLVLARYLIEDNYFEEIELDLNRSSEIDLIALIFKKLIGVYKLIDKKTEEKLFMDLSMVS